MIDYAIGDKVYINSYEGFGGPATIIETRDCPHGRYKVAMDDNNPPPFWAHDFEVEPPLGDMRRETLDHIRLVRRGLESVREDIASRAEVHDASKLVEPERSAFQEVTAKLKGSTYGSDEYKQFLAELKPTLDHHYAANSHHPEHYPDGIDGMNLLDLIEMLCDWKAATQRHADGDIRRSLEINKERFQISPQLAKILANTVDYLGY